ncbi:MAG: 16S rRNA (adenine(1518)-N(6)/adenine(1519)-N(6))-dimethyltransferase RsmA [Gammaproteobacteria bacterium]|nr:16S rRNA (adenine(1518)-N(6)/adenine(1519)-N(6))-dimethyltransferase RsmA [Gammaproteobacteria bacterium]
MPSQVRKRFGQHFLVDQGIIDRIFQTINVRSDQRLLEIGPGRGELTAGLSRLSNRVVAIELDRDLVKNLESKYPNTSFIQGDVLKQPLENYEGFRVVGNLPYEISTPLITKLIENVQVIDMHFMLQREVAQRLVAQPRTKEYGRLSVVVQYWCEVSSLFNVEPESFQPPPKVRSSFVCLRPKETVPEDIDYQDFKRVVSLAFSQRRKTLRNSLKELSIGWDTSEISSRLRADEVSLEQYLTFTRQLTAKSDSNKSL